MVATPMTTVSKGWQEASVNATLATSDAMAAFFLGLGDISSPSEYVITITISLSFSYDRIIPRDAKY